MATRRPISRDELDAGNADLAELDSGERLAPIHPGQVLRHDFLDPLHLTAHAPALALRVPANRITAILAGRRAITAETALRQMEARFEAVQAELAPKFTGRLKPQPSDYQARGAIFLPENACFSGLLALPGNADLGAALNAAMKGIADANPELAAALPPALEHDRF
jgi:addiction module HigA family antidote